ncbi:SpaA isopeptide-forming pilin-related protein [Pueribacillus sp. YX66]|uniref:SpaA isopeptide-forming pilin-related protein n=1 Tax=Pueribacillus sp. YX66 TaxID=3229242 RepID=UPI00358D4614
MRKNLSLVFVFLLFFHTLTSSALGISSEAIAEGLRESIFTNVLVMDKNDVEIKNIKEHQGENVTINATWSVVDVSVEAGDQDLLELPTELLIENEQSGVLASDGVEIGIYKASANGTISVTFNEQVENHHDASGEINIDAVVASNPATKETGGEENEVEEVGKDEKVDLEGHTNIHTVKQSSANVITENIITDVKLYQRFEDGTDDILLTPGEEIELERPYDAFKVTIKYDFALPNNHDYMAGSTYKIKVPEPFKVQANTEPIPLSTADGTVFGTFISNNNNEILITFNSEIEGNSKISGFIQLESEFDNHYSDGAARQNITFPISEDGEVTYPVKFIPEGSSISKTADVDQPYNTKEITWTVDFNKDLQKLTNAVLDDNLTGKQDYIPGSFEFYELEMNIDGTIKSEKPLPENYFGENPIFPLNLGDIDEAYRVVYKTKVAEGDSGTTYKNDVALKSSELADNSLKAHASVNVKRGQPLEKMNGHYDKTNQTVEWIVKYNYDEKSINQDKAVLTDVLQGNHKLLPDSFEVYKIEIDQTTGNELSRTKVDQEDVDGYVITETTDPNGFEFQFKQKIQSAYEIRYKTTAINRPGEGDTPNSNVITNTISDEFGNSKSKSTTITQQIFFKSHSGINYEDKKVSWNISINEDKQKMENVVFNDKLPEGFTIDENGIKVTHGGTLLTRDDYNLRYNEETGEIEIEFLNEIEDVVKINYTTIFDYDSIITDQGEDRKQTHTNKANIVWEVEHTPGSKTKGEQEAETTFTPDNYTNQNGFKDGSYNPVSKEINWRIGVNYNKETLNDVVVEDRILGNQNFDISSVKVFEMKLTGGRNGIRKGDELTKSEYTVEPISDGNKTIGFRLLLGDIKEPYLIEYKTDLNGLLVDAAYDNTATVQSENKNDFDLTATVTPYEGGKYTNKQGKQNNENPRIVNWIVDINRSQSYLENVVITDTLSKNQTLRKDSIVLYGTEVSTNPNKITKDESKVFEEGTDYSITFEENEDGSETFTLTFINPIEEAYVLEYDSYILFKGSGDEANFKNSFTLNGEGTESVSSGDPFSREIDISRIVGGITGEVGTLTVTKVDADAPNEPLEGATFELYDAAGNFIRSGITDEKGKVTFKNLLYDKQYTLKETEAPKGYVVSIKDGATFEFKKNEEELQIENHKFIGTVELTKVDEDTKEALKGVVFELQDKEGNTLQENLTTDENGKITVDGLKPGHYFFKEVQALHGYESLTDKIPFTIEADQIEVLQLDPVENNIIHGSVQLKKVDKDNNNEPLEDAEFKLVDAENNLVMENLKTNIEGIVTVNDLRPGTYYFIETKAPEHYELDETPIQVIVEKAQTEIATVQSENELITGSVVLTKKGEDDKLLEGVVFELQDENGEKVSEHTTDANGKIVVENLKPGIYQFVETKSIPGYEINPTVEKFEIIKSQETAVTVEFTNDLTPGAVKLTKLGEENEGLAGAEFTLLDEEGNELQTNLMTNDEGKLAVTDLKPGKYSFVETKAPFGHELDATPVEFEIEFNQQSQVGVTKVNERSTSGVQLTKKGEDGNLLEGVTFELQDEDGNTLQEGLTTDENGLLTVDNLKPGQYQFVETETIAGYELNDERIPFEIELGQTTRSEVEFVNELTTGSVELIKVGEQDETLAGAEFTLLDEEGNELQTNLTTNDEGKLAVTDLKPGKYSFVETKAPFGHELDATPVEFEIEFNQQSQVGVTKVNERSTSGVQLTKKGEDGNLLEGVTFELQDEDGNTLQEGLTTDENGLLIVDNLKPGHYQFVETETIAGYELNDEQITFEVELGQTTRTKVEFVNELMTGSVELTKIDDETGETLADAVFKLQDSEGNLLQKELTTDKNGKIRVTDLKPGDYQFVETKAPKGYKLGNAPITFTIEKGQTKIEKVVVENKKEDTASTDANKTGKKLPKTATIIFNSLLLGVVIAVAGLTVLYVRRKRAIK